MDLILAQARECGAVDYFELLAECVRVTGSDASLAWVTPEQVEAKLTEEKTTPEERHAWIIAVTPEIDDDAEDPTAEQAAAARETAEQALEDIRSVVRAARVSRARQSIRLAKLIDEFR